MRILLLGARGQLGRDCESVLKTAHDVVGVDMPEVDLRDCPLVVDLTMDVRPDIILNCAAYTQVDRAESDHATAHAINAGGPQCLAQVARQVDAFLVHISTEYVFDGRRPAPEPYTEDDEPNPIGRYGRSKFAGEQAITEVGPRHAIVRSAWLYGRHGTNFIKAILRKVRRAPNTPMWVVNDQYGCPTWSRRLALQISRLIETQTPGLFHAVSGGHTTWHDFAKEFFAMMNMNVTVQPCSSRDNPAVGPRPTNAILANTRLTAMGINIMRDWREDLQDFVARYGAELVEEIAAEPAG